MAPLAATLVGFCPGPRNTAYRRPRRLWRGRARTGRSYRHASANGGVQAHRHVSTSPGYSHFNRYASTDVYPSSNAHVHADAYGYSHSNR